MKCLGIIKVKNKQGKQRTRVCGEKLSEHDIFCHSCGYPTNALSTELSARKSFTETWQIFKGIKSNSYMFAILMIIILGLSIYLAILTSNNYLYNNLVLLVMVPFLVLPMAGKEGFTKSFLTVGTYLKNLKYYPAFFLFVLINVLYFFH